MASVDAIPGPIDEPMNAIDIRMRFPEPRPTIEWVKQYLGEMEEAGDVSMYALGSCGMSNAGRWLHYRWAFKFYDMMGMYV